MRFLVDAQLPPALARFLHEHGHEAMAARDAGLREAEDPQIWSFAEAGAWIVVTFQWIVPASADRPHEIPTAEMTRRNLGATRDQVNVGSVIAGEAQQIVATIKCAIAHLFVAVMARCAPPPLGRVTMRHSNAFPSGFFWQNLPTLDYGRKKSD